MTTYNTNHINQLFSVLTDEQKQLMADLFNYGGWGDGSMEFYNAETQDWETDMMFGYITNEAKKAGHFSGRKVSAMYRSIYNRLGFGKNGANLIFCHCSDWWGDGTGDMFFLRDLHAEDGTSLVSAVEEWAKEYK